MGFETKKLPVVIYAETLPGGLMDADKFSAHLCERGVKLTPGRLTGLADAFCIPHYRVDGGPPLFAAPEARKWIAKNLTQRIEGSALPVEFRVLVDCKPGVGVGGVPQSLVQIADKLIWQADICAVCGVYFLCRENRVVYVGQSACTGARIATHRLNGRKFDRAFVLPVPASSLDDVEGAFIRALKPEENKSCPADRMEDTRVLSEFGYESGA